MDVINITKDLTDIYTRVDTLLCVWSHYVPRYYAPKSKYISLRNRCIAALRTHDPVEYKRVWVECKPEWDRLWRCICDNN